MGHAANHLGGGQLEDIAKGLFTVQSEKGGELIGLCPVHDEQNPSFSYNPAKDKCHCFSCGFGGDIIDLWRTVRGYADKKEGFKAFCDEFGISDSLNIPKYEKKPETPPLNDAYDMLGQLPDDWIKKLIQIRGWSPGAMAFLGLRQQTHYQDKKTGDIKLLKRPERVAIPVTDDQGDVRNIRLYKTGPLRGKEAKIISWGKQYGDARLFPAMPREKGTVLLCEGEPDTICAISQGFNAITQTSKPKSWKKDQLAKFKDRDVVIAFDADQPGQMYAKEYAGPQISKVARSVRILEWPDFMGRRQDGLWPEKDGQDLTDFFVKHRQTAVDLERLMDAAAFFQPPDPDVDVQCLEFFERGVNDRLSFKPRLLAEKILSLYTVLYIPDTGLMYRYNKRYWEIFFEDHLKAVAVKMLGNEAKQAWVQDAIFQVKTLSTIPHGRELNDRMDFICVKNGMLNIRTGELSPHAPEYYATYELDVTFNPESKDRCNRFLQFLQETVQTPEVIMQVQEFMGYCFLRQVPFAKCLLLLGPGSDGKSKLLKLIRELVGPDNCAAVSFSEMEDQFLRSSLYQKAVNISTEIGSKAVESPYFKAITAGDPVNAAFKHKNTFSFIPYCKLIFAANKMPRVLDNSDGLFRRILPIEFKRQFAEDDPDTDPFLEDKLLAEKSEIFHWALAGLQRLMRTKRFTASDETERLLMEYKRLNNPVVCFVQDMCELDSNSMTQKADLFKKYEEYCRSGNYRAYSRENFFRELYAAWNSLKVSRLRTQNNRREYYIHGIRLVEVLG
mgnify:CR=1 FL=1